MDTNRPALILEYGGLAARELIQTDDESLSEIQNRKKEIEEELGMTPEDIIVEASRIVVNK